MVKAVQERKYDVSLSNEYSADLYRCRDKCLLTGGDEADPNLLQPFRGNPYDFIVWLDSDVTFNPDDVFKLIETCDREGFDILGGVVPLNPVNVNCGYKKPGEFTKLTKDDIYGKTEPFEVDWVGYGCVCVRKGVFEKMGYPWFRTWMVYYPELNVKMSASEDIGWSLRAKEEHGFKIHVDPSVRLGHQKYYSLTWNNDPWQEVKYSESRH